MSPSQTRLSNARKLNTDIFYTPPFRRGIPWSLAILVAFQTCVFGAAIAFNVGDEAESKGISFLHWVLIPLLTLSISLVDGFYRFTRTLHPLRTVITAFSMLALWIVFVFLGLLPDYVFFLFPILAIPGLVASFVYLVLATVALVRERKQGGEGKMGSAVGSAVGMGDVELEPQAGRQAGSTRSRTPPGQNKAVNVEEESWSPLR